MKKYSVMITVLVLFLGIEKIMCTTLKPSMFSLFSWNILGPNTKDAQDFFPHVKGVNPYDRLDAIVAKIKAARPSIICLQEVDETSLGILSAALKNYIQVVYQPKGKNGGVVLYVQQGRFDVQHPINIELHSKGAAAGALLISKKTGLQFFVSSVHIGRGNSCNIKNSKEGEKQLEKLITQINKVVPDQATIPSILAGDFNTNSSEISGCTLQFLECISDKKYTDSFPNTITAHRKDGIPSSIDHILYADATLVAKHSNVGEMDQYHSPLIYKQYPSDHLPLYAVFIDAVKPSKN